MVKSGHTGAAPTAARLTRIAGTVTSLANSATSTTRYAATLGHQAWQTYRSVPRLPDARGRDGIATTVRTESSTKTIRTPDSIGLEPDSPHAYHLVVLGDSVAAGVGLDHHRNSIAGRLASLLSERCGHPVAWHVIARSGADARGILSLAQQPENAQQLASCDAIVLSVGVNDVLAARIMAAWRRDLSNLLTHLTTLNSTAAIILLGVPPIEKFPAVPAQLGDVLGRRAHRFDDVGIAAAGCLPRVHHLSLSDPDLSLEKAFADDGFHPSSKLHKRIAKRADRIMTGADVKPEPPAGSPPVPPAVHLVDPHVA